MLVLGKPFQHGLMIKRRAGTFCLWKAPGLTHKNYTTLEDLPPTNVLAFNALTIKTFARFEREVETNVDAILKFAQITKLFSLVMGPISFQARNRTEQSIQVYNAVERN
jgi:hypothetical protein